VATLTLLGSPNIGAPKLLYALVFGEAVLNDAVAIVLYKTFEGFLKVEFTNATIFYAFTKFIFISIGSVVLGFLIAIACSLVFRRATNLKNLPHMEISLLLLFAYASYFGAELCGLSGIMSLFFCSIALAHYNFYNLSEGTQHTTHLYFKSMAQICDTFVFAYLGITIGVSIDPQSGYLLTWSPPLIFITLALCLVGRAANVFPLSWLINRVRLTPVDTANQASLPPPSSLLTPPPNVVPFPLIQEPSCIHHAHAVLCFCCSYSSVSSDLSFFSPTRSACGLPVCVAPSPSRWLCRCRLSTARRL
jgi:NhaP-type Na+/H+ or K+/H+ antiporter